MKNRIAKMRKKAGLSQTQLAKMIDSKSTQLGKLERGERRLSDHWMGRIAKALNCSPIDLMGESDLPVVGYIGAGAAVYFHDDYAMGDGMNTVERPPIGVEGVAVALEIKGTSMLPRYLPGWKVIYSRDRPWDLQRDILNQDCVVRLADGRTYLKQVTKGSDATHFHLMSLNDSPIENVEIEWAAPVMALVR